MAGTLQVNSPVSIILKAGLIAGTLDISDALIFNGFRGVTAKALFQHIASGLIGAVHAVQGGLATALLGLLLHYFIALIWTAVFYAASRRIVILRRRPVACGLLYGFIVYLFMNWIVLPLSRVPHTHNAVTIASRVNGILAVMFCIGLTISLLVHRYTSQPFPAAERDSITA